MDLNALLALIPAQYLGYVTGAVAACAAFTAIVPPPKNRRTGWAYIYAVLDFIALNIGHGVTAAKVATHTPASPRNTSNRDQEMHRIVGVAVALAILASCASGTESAARSSAMAIAADLLALQEQLETSGTTVTPGELVVLNTGALPVRHWHRNWRARGTSWSRSHAGPPCDRATSDRPREAAHRFLRSCAPFPKVRPPGLDPDSTTRGAPYAFGNPLDLERRLE